MNLKRKKLTENFYEDEFYSPDTKSAKMNMEFMYKLQRLRTIVDVEFTITSGYRSEAYNAIVKGGSQSQHLLGNAVDIDHQRWDAVTRYRFLTAALSLGFSVGIYQKHFHVDNRMTTKVLWIGKNVTESS